METFQQVVVDFFLLFKDDFSLFLFNNNIFIPFIMPFHARTIFKIQNQYSNLLTNGAKIQIYSRGQTTIWSGQN